MPEESVKWVCRLSGAEGSAPAARRGTLSGLSAIPSSAASDCVPPMSRDILFARSLRAATADAIVAYE
eukprot:2254258-Rhodomonas_salina.1